MIYIVEDDENIREIKAYTLQKNGFEVQGFSDGESILNECIMKRPDLIILDIMLPGKDGLTILDELKSEEKTKDIPVMLISAKTAELDKVRGLDMGADDYMIKPFGTLELASRVKAIMRRLKIDDDVLEFSYKTIIIDDSKRNVTISNGENIELTYKEYELLKYFVINSGMVLSRDKILEKVWGFDFSGESRTVDMHIKTLRQKLCESGTLIKTVRNVGYILD